MEIQELASNINQNQELVQLPGFFELLKESFKIVKEKIWIYLGIVAVLAIGYLVSYSLLFPLLFGSMMIFGMVPSGWLFFVVLLFLFSIIGMFLGIWPILAIFYVTKERYRNVGIFEALKKTFSKVLSAFWISLSVSLIVSAGMLLLVVPGLIFLSWFCLSTPVLLSENIRGFRALSRSKELVKGKAVFTKLVGLVAISGFVSFVTDPLLETDSIIKILIAFLVLMLSALISNVFIFLIYEKLRKMEKGGYKEERIGEGTYQEAQVS